MIIKVPPDLIAALGALFWETLVYYLFSYLLMIYFITQLETSSLQSGIIYAVFGAILSIMSIFFGSFIDRLLLRKTLLLQLAVGTGSMALLCLLPPNKWVTCAILCGPVAFSLAIGLPAIPVAVRRYTTKETQTLGFGILYVVINLGTAAAQICAE
jgi:predicted MFS family arabinose efflux permease